MEPKSCEFVTALVVALSSSINTATQTTVGTSAAPNARRQTFASASERDVVGSLVRSARTAAASQPGTINSKGVFRVTAAFQTSQRLRARIRAKGRLRH